MYQQHLNEHNILMTFCNCVINNNKGRDGHIPKYL